MLAEDRQDTYNFEVADYHTYFVGKEGAWVHNTCKVPEKVIKNIDDVSKLSLRGRSLKSGRKKLSELGLKERLTRTGRHEFVDSNGLIRAAYDPVSQKRGGHWHKFAYPNNSKVSLNNAGRVVDRKSTSAHIPRQRNRRE